MSLSASSVRTQRRRLTIPVAIAAATSVVGTLVIAVLSWMHVGHRESIVQFAATRHAGIQADLPPLPEDEFGFVAALAVVVLMGTCFAVYRLARASESARLALEAQASHLQVAMSAAPLGTWEWDIPSGSVRWSDNLWTMFGLKPGSRAMNFELFRDSLHPEDRERVMETLRESLASGLPYYHQEARVQRPDGTVRWMLMHGRVVYDAAGNAVRMSGVDFDISDRKDAQIALQASHELLRTAFEATVLGMAIVAPDGRWLQVNGALCRLLGYTREELLASDFQAITHPADLEESLALSRQLHTGEIDLLHQEKRYRHHDGHYLWVYVTVGIVRNRDGTPRYHITQVQDISPRKRAEASLVDARRAAEASERAKSEMLDRLNEAQHAANIGSWNWDAASGAIWWSDELYRIFELDPAQYTPGVEQNAAFVHDDDREKHRAGVTRAIQDGIAFEIDLRIVTATGRIRYCRDRGDPERDADGTLRRVGGTFQDITERRALEAQLRDAQKMESLGSLAGGIAHDFNNLLGVILGNVSLARSHIDDPLAMAQKLARIDEAGQRARALVDQILTFSRRQPMTMRATDLGAVVREALGLLRSTIPAGIAFSADIDDSTPAALADPSQIHQIVMNLCTNAWHAIRERVTVGGRIEVKVYAVEVDERGPGASDLRLRSGRYCCIGIGDNGVGMNDATRARIFEPFFTTRDPGAGTGLGLSVVHGIIAAHHGAITVDSQPDEGSRFTLYLPVAPTQVQLAPTDSPRISAARAASGLHVMYIDDEPALTALVTELLEAEGLHVTVCGDAREALRHMSDHAEDIDAVVTDYNMPGLSGIDLAAILVREHPNLPVFVSSGYFTPELQQQAASLGVRALMNKTELVNQLPVLLRGLARRRPVP